MSRGWLIDTNIPNGSSLGPMSGVVRWLDEVDEDRVFLSVISLAEICIGVERLGLAPGRRRTRLDAWLREEPPVRFERRIVPVDREVADACGRFVGASAGGRPRARRDRRLDRRHLPGARPRPRDP